MAQYIPSEHVFKCIQMKKNVAWEIQKYKNKDLVNGIIIQDKIA